MSNTKPHLYINSNGYAVTRHSYSGGDSFNFCARKYYLERVLGWFEKVERSSKFFGIALEKGVTFWHQHRQDTDAAVAEFARLWAEHRDKPYTYSKIDGDWDRLNLSGQELIKLYAVLYPSLPFIVKNPADFQVESSFEVFPGTELAGLEFTSYIDLIAELKAGGLPLIIDIKTSGKDIPEFTILDPQLRSYAWVKDWPNVGFLWFRKCGRTISRGDRVTLLEPIFGFAAGEQAVVMAKDAFGIRLAKDKQVLAEMDRQFIGESQAVKDARQKFAECHGTLTSENKITKQQVQFKNVVITKESMEDIGRSIKRDMINIVNATERDFFPMQSGVRFPNEKCPICPMRGICANRADLRDELLTRKQVDEVDFGKESE